VGNDLLAHAELDRVAGPDGRGGATSSASTCGVLARDDAAKPASAARLKASGRPEAKRAMKWRMAVIGRGRRAEARPGRGGVDQLVAKQ
jgi:hypothetical protein